MRRFRSNTRFRHRFILPYITYRMVRKSRCFPIKKAMIWLAVAIIFMTILGWRFSTKLPEGFTNDPTQLRVVRRERSEKSSVFVRIRNGFISKIQRAMPEEEASLGVGYLLGSKDNLSKDLRETLSLVGLSHIVVASGTHLGILIGFLKRVFGKISRFAGLLFSITFIFLFGMMVGWTPSITRAGIVAVISLLIWYVGETARPWRVILASVGITLLIEPLYLFDLGWQLSFASFIGILVLAPLILEFFYDSERPWLAKEERRKTEASIITKMIVATITATIMVTPILLFNFGSLSLISIVANLLILPTMSLAMGATFLAGSLGFFFRFGAKVMGLIATWIIDYHLFVINFSAERTEFLIRGFQGDSRIFLLYIPIILLIVVGDLLRAQKRAQITQTIRKNPRKYLRWSRP